ncbi:recombinase family protein [Micromonospora provocatoris]|uniref:recombinase family protein n=1 Tax=Micromonospora provocatoris TaxID=322610 RepID=UPI003D2A5345
MIYGYKRPLYNDKNCENQLITDAIYFDKIFEEAHGMPKKRQQLEDLLISLQQGDEIYVQSFFAIADSIRHLMEILKICEMDGVTIYFMKEEVNSRDLLLCTLQDLLHRMIEFQTDITRHSTIIGMTRAKENGKTIGRPKKTDEKIEKAISMYHSGKYTLLDIKDKTGISKSTLYRYLESMNYKH